MAPSLQFLAIGALSTFAAASSTPRASVHIPRLTSPTFNFTTFSSVVPSPKLNWTDCYGPKFQCTYLTVPLDYEDLIAGTTDIAFIRYLVNETLPDLLYNPGGPGGSGVESLQGWGPRFAKRWPSFNFVSFDPRGVKWTGPRLYCSNDSSESTDLRRRDGEPNRLGNLTEQWDEAVENNRACSEFNEHTDAKYVGTLAVVQDMMHFTEVQAAARGQDPAAALINYYGVSYGTQIGHTLVATYPDRINRVVVDANTNSVASYTGWEPTTIDGYDEVVGQFCKLCAEAGEKWCVLATGSNSIAADVQAKFDAALEMLRTSPVEFNGKMYDDYMFLDSLAPSMYSPRSPFKGYLRIANATASVLKGDAANAFRSVETEEEDDGSPKATDYELKIITAADVADRFPFDTYEAWKAAGEKLASTARYGAKGYVLGFGTAGPGMSINPPPSQYFPGFNSSIATRRPVLFVNNKGDHVTPPTGARAMSKIFEGSAVVIVDGPGHGFANAPSHCTNAIVKEYMSTGKVPEEREVVCKPDVEAEFYFGGKAEEWMDE